MRDTMIVQFIPGTAKSLNTLFYGVTSCDQTYYSDYSGWLGLAPYTAVLSAQQQALNFMNNLVLSNNIEHNVVSIYSYSTP